MRNLRNQHGLIFTILYHELISVIGHGIQMGRHFGLSLASVYVYKNLAVNGETLVRIDGHTKKS